ncbi:hypothetical protein [Pseudonocardia alni]|uniref:hypothetical protein n=1 Tax=Pseudonocardia alni TaxID=33907 RepID=UPI00332B224E
MTQPQTLSHTAAYLRLVDGHEDTVVPSGSSHRKVPLPVLVLGVLALIAISALVYIGSTASTETNRADDASAQLSLASGQANDLAEKIAAACQAGAVPVPYTGACSAAQEVKNSPVIAAGVAGDTGATGAAGTPGRDGRDGRDGKDGSAGTPGTPGATGAPGASPPCLATPAMCQGQDGRNGTDGANGSPPVRWTSTLTDGSTQTCTRAEGFDAAAPAYTCTTTASPSAQPGRDPGDERPDG